MRFEHPVVRNKKSAVYYQRQKARGQQQEPGNETFESMNAEPGTFSCAADWVENKIPDG